jgi:hypothetical protein
MCYSSLPPSPWVEHDLVTKFRPGGRGGCGLLKFLLSVQVWNFWPSHRAGTSNSTISRFKVPIALLLRIQIFRDVALCCWTTGSLRFIESSGTSPPKTASHPRRPESWNPLLLIAGVVSTVGWVVWPPRAVESDGRKNWRQNEYFKLKNLSFCAQQILNYWNKHNETQ